MHQLSIPAGPEEITPAWFTAVFQAYDATAGTVVDVKMEIIGQDRGFTGIIARARLRYEGRKEEAAPASVVVKFPTAVRVTPSAYRAAQQQNAEAARRYFERCAREVAFYQQIAPLSSLPIPRLYYGAANSATGHVILVLEDLESARGGDALDGCTPQEAALVVEQLANFHARWWQDPRLEMFSWLPVWGGDSQVAQKRYTQCIGPFLQRFGSRVPEPALKLIDALATNYGAVRSRLQQAPATMIHGDLHLDNILFSPPEHRPGITLLDWQSVARGRGAIDLALFLFDALKMPGHRTVENELLRRYHELLLAGGVTGYDFPQLREDCQLALLWLLGSRVVWLGSLDLESLDGRELALVEASLTKESFAAVFDYGADSLLPL